MSNDKLDEMSDNNSNSEKKRRYKMQINIKYLKCATYVASKIINIHYTI